MTIARRVDSIADQLQKSSAQVALNWIRHQPQKNPIIPILGARTNVQFIDNLGCLDFSLTKEQFDSLQDISSIELGFPHDFLNGELAQQMVYGNFKDKIFNPKA